MKKKGILICGALLVLACCLGGWFLWQDEQKKSATSANEKEITINIIDASTKEEFELYKGTNVTETTTLSDFLLELKENKIITLESYNSTYGMYITGMGGANIMNENPAENIYWVFESNNNASCMQAEFCPAAEQVYLANGDKFTFKLEKMSNE